MSRLRDGQLATRPLGRWRRDAVAILLGCSLLTGCVAGRRATITPSPDGAARSVLELEFLDMTTLPSALPADPAPVGGLSGLAWYESSSWLAVSDDPARRGPARLYRLELPVPAPRWPAPGVSVSGTIELLDEDGTPFRPHTVDMEDLALAADGTIFVSSEGNAENGIAPWVRRFSPAGRTIQQLPIPDYYSPAPNRGIVHNSGFEALTLTPDGRRLVVGTESALRQDGSAHSWAASAPARLLVFDTQGSLLLSEHVYRVEPVSRPPARPGGFAVRGLTALLALDASRLLALEREYVEGHGNTVILYELSLHGADDVSGLASLRGRTPRPVRKRPLLDMAQLGVPIDNLEGLALGPRLPDGRRLLVLVSDDNFNPRSQITQFLAFALSDPTPEATGASGRGR